MTTLEIRPPSHDETSRVVSLLTAGETEMRRRLISASVSGALSNTQAKTIGLVAVREGEVVGAAIATALPGGTGVLAGMRVADSADEETAKQLFDAVAQYLIALGVHFLQVACSIEGAPPELAHAGFGHLADLEYLSVDTAQLKHEASPEFILRPASHLTESQLSDLVAQTYIETKDCPQMSSFRSAAETLASYRASPTHDPSMWRVAFAEDAPVGCVLGLPFADSSIMELTYMGVVPAARGKGLGRELVNETRRMAIEQKLDSISLAVDLTNEPACRIYRDLGFVSVYAEAVWGIRLSAEPQIET